MSGMIQHAKRVLERERADVVKTLGQVFAYYEAQSRRQLAMSLAEQYEVARLLVRGKEAGLTVSEMAFETNFSRQAAHGLIRRLEQGDSFHAGFDDEELALWERHRGDFLRAVEQTPPSPFTEGQQDPRERRRLIKRKEREGDA